MKKSNIFLFLILMSNLIYSQSEKNELNFEANGIYIVLQNTRGEQLTKIPYGKEVEVSYDVFFKKIAITYINREDQIAGLELFYLSEKEVNGVKYFQMKDDFGNIYNVLGNIEKIQTLLIIFDKKNEDGNITLLAIEGMNKKE